MKKSISWVIVFLLELVFLFLQLPSTVFAVNPTAVADIITSTEYDVPEGFLGFNNHMTNVGYNSTDPSVVDLAKEINGKYYRWSAGTANDVFNPKTGRMPEERNAQLFDNHLLYHKYDDESKLSDAKGPQNLIDFYEFCRQNSAKLTIVVNAFTGTPGEYADIAKFCKDNNILVEYWELNNEPYLFLSDNDPKFYNSAVDYANQLKPYNDAIKGIDPNAKTVIAYTPVGDRTWDTSLRDYSPRYWDAIVWHSYEGGDASNFDDAVKSANTMLNDMRSRIDNNYVANSWSTVPIINNEMDVKVAGPLYASQYNALFAAESVMRMSTSSNMIMMSGTGGLAFWTIDSAVDYIDRELDSYERDQVFNTSNVDHQLYLKAPGAACKIVYNAINRSTTRWNTNVTGGINVLKSDGTTMPAIYATAYNGNYNNNNKNYLLITNKSDQTHDITIKMNGSDLNAALTKVYITSTDPQAQNTRTNPNTIAIQTATTTNPVSVPPYSVMRVEWDRNDSLTVPVVSRITSALTGNDQVTLKWWDVEGPISYSIKYGTSSGVYTQSINAGSVTYYTVTGLNNNTDYYFVIQVVNSAGSSNYSNEVKVRTSAPAIPNISRAFGKRDKKIQVEWKSVPYASGYKVKYGTTSGNYTTTIDVGNVLGYDITGLTSGTDYYVVVSAYNGKGESGNSSVLSAKPRVDLAYTPNNLRLTSSTSTSATLAWDPSFVRVFKDYYEDGESGGWTVTKGTWSVVDHPGANRSTKVYKVTSTGGLAQSNAGDASWTDYFVDVKAEVSSWNTDGTVSILGRYTDDNNYYRFVYNSTDQDYKLIKSVNGTFTTLDTKSLSEVINLMTFNAFDEKNVKMTMQFSGSNIQCMLNNKLVLEANDTSHTSGKIALASNKQQAMFDKVYVWSSNMNSGTYKVYRSTAPTSGYTVIASNLTSPAYTNTGLTDGVTYYYKVTAVNAAGVESVERSRILVKN